jgi:hypothetical protein
MMARNDKLTDSNLMDQLLDKFRKPAVTYSTGTVARIDLQLGRAFTTARYVLSSDLRCKQRQKAVLVRGMLVLTILYLWTNPALNWTTTDKSVSEEEEPFIN